MNDAETTPLVAEDDSAENDALEQGTRVGRFLVLERLGVGGMGEVYAAYDPQLDRRVALKLVRPGRGVSESRVLREAQALAQVGHPNVVHVYDVGRFEARIFIAMELVEGMDLRERLKAGVHDWRVVLRWLIDAGRGLAAAHQAQVLHGDIKPTNVLVGDDGQVKVTDFGLARRVDASRDSLEAGVGPDTPGTSSDTSIGGTPPYLAPEQNRGRVSTIRSDIYQFSVTAWEALFGQRPYAGASYEALQEAKRAGPPQSPETKAPRGVVRALCGGLEPDPSRRPASLPALLDALETALTRGRPHLAVASAVVVTAALGLALWPAPDPCEEGAALLDPVWSASRAEAVAQALRATATPFAETTAQQSVATIDAYAERWIRVHRDVCEATRTRGTQSEAVMDLRMRCLSRRLREVDALAGQLEVADATVAANAVAAADALSSVEGCRDVLPMDAPQPPQDPDTVAEVEAIEHQLDEAEALRRAGRYEDATSLASSMVARAEAVGYAPTVAAARLIRGMASSAAGRSDEAAEALLGAVAAAEVGQARWTKARAWGWLVYVAGVQQAEFARGLEHEALAEASLQAAGAGPTLSAELATAQGLLQTARGELDAAREHHARALSLRTEALGEDSLAVAASHNNLGQVFDKLGEPEEAQRHYLRALEIRRARLGERHPDVAQVLGNYGGVLSALGDAEAAEDAMRTSLQIRTEVLGPEHPQTLSARINVATLLWGRGQADEAAALAREAAEASARVHGLHHPRTLRAFNNLCIMLGRMERPGAGITACGRVAETSDGRETSLELLTVRTTFGELLLQDGQGARAVELLEEVLASSEGLPIHVSAQSGLGRALVEQGRYEEAIPLLEAALSAPDSPVAPNRARLQLNLAIALWETGGSRARARALAEEATADEVARDAASAWLRAHP